MILSLLESDPSHTAEKELEEEVDLYSDQQVDPGVGFTVER